MFNVIKSYCREAVEENCVRLVYTLNVQFIQELVEYRDYYQADCRLTREEMCEVLATE